MKYEKMFTPIKIGTMELKNRLVVAPMAMDFCDADRTLNEEYAAYVSSRARGGFSMIITEGSIVDTIGYALERMAGICDDRFIPGFKRVADAAHEYGAKLIVQIHHAGAQAPSFWNDGAQPVPS